MELRVQRTRTVLVQDSEIFMDFITSIRKPVPGCELMSYVCLRTAIPCDTVFSFWCDNELWHYFPLSQFLCNTSFWGFLFWMFIFVTDL